MSDQPGLDVDKMIKDEQERQRQWEEIKKRYDGLTMQGYLGLVEKDPRIAQNTQKRVLEMILEAGLEDIPEEEWSVLMFDDDEAEKKNNQGYKFFRNQLFGIDRVLRDVVDHIKSGAYGLSTGKKLLLLVGPPSAGKNSIVTAIKRGMERASAYPIFRITGCPMQEEPLRLIPLQSGKREETAKQLGVKIEGELCPICNDAVKKMKGEWWKMPVEVFRLSEQDRCGLSAWEPSDGVTETVAGLVGGENIAISGQKGSDHPRAFAFWNGALPMANRGVFEGVEILRADPKTMRVFFSACEEKRVKTPESSFSYVYLDSLLVGHTNLVKYKEYRANKENEGLLERMFPVFVNYTLRIKDEVRIYRKLIETEADFVNLRKVHIGPGTLELAALFAIMTRLNEAASDISILSKAKVYNGDVVLTDLMDSEKDPIDERSLIEEGQEDDDIAKREGMHGLGSRDVLTAINKALIELGEMNGCLTPTKIIRALGRIDKYLMNLTTEDFSRYRDELLLADDDSVVSEYKDFIVKTVSRVFLRVNEPLAQNIFKSYLEEVKFYCAIKRKFFPSSGLGHKRDFIGKKRDPDEKLMRSIEEHGQISEDKKDTFRSEMLQALSDNSNDISYTTYKPLAEMINRKLLTESKGLLKAVLSQDIAKNEEAQVRAKDLFQGLLDNRFCKVCAREAIEKTGEFSSE